MTPLQARAAIRARVLAATGLQASQVIYALQGPERPAAPVVLLQVITETPQGHAHRTAPTVASQRVIARVQLDAIGDAAVAALASATLRLGAEDHDGTLGLQEIGPRRDATTLYRSTYEPRATVDMRWMYVQTASVPAEVDVSGYVLGIAGDDGTAVLGPYAVEVD